MGGFWGPMVGLLAVLLGIYYTLDNSCPTMFYPELNKIHGPLAVSLDPAPRKGEVVPASDFSAYISNPSLFLSHKVATYDPKKISLFAKGTNGEEHPANAYLLGFVPFPTKQFWLPLTAVSLRVRYMRDDEFQEKGTDKWQTSLETYLERWGDCEDHAILLVDWMVGLGYDAWVVLGTVKNEGHAWVVLYKDEKEYLLESTDKASRRRYPLVALHPEYVPAFMFNREHFWARTIDPPHASRQTREEWLLLSNFKETYYSPSP